jgi:hypothetical protein
MSRSNSPLVLRDHHPAVAVPAEVLRREEAEGADGGRLAAMRRSPPITRLAPIDCAASSITGRPGAAAATRSSGASCPKRSTGITAFVRAVTPAADRVGRDQERVGVDVHEHRRRADVVDRARGREEGERSGDHLVPRPTSSARSASRIASVPLAQPIANRACESPATSHSSLRTGSPRMNAWSSTTRIMASTTDRGSWRAAHVGRAGVRAWGWRRLRGGGRWTRGGSPARPVDRPQALPDPNAADDRYRSFNGIGTSRPVRADS